MATSAIAACVDKYATLSGVPQPLYFGDVPVSDGTSQILPPYVALIDEGMKPEFNFVTSEVLEATDLTFMVYGNSLAAVDAIVQAIKYNGQVPSAAAGFDFGTLASLESPYRTLSIYRTSERRFVAETTGKQSQRISGCELKYRVSIFLYGT